MAVRNSVDVLRYWLALLRHEEALAVRPRARKIPPNELTAVPSLTAPTPGQDYMKLPFAGQARFFAQKRGRIEQRMDGEANAFFEDWLYQRSRRGGEDESLEHLVFFPAVLLPRGELAGLLRFAVSLSWLKADGETFTLPSAAERVKKQFPAPPSTLRLTATASAADENAPFFVDARLLRETLVIDMERQDAFFAALRERALSAPQMLAALCRLLLDQLAADGEESDEAEVRSLSAILAEDAEEAAQGGRKATAPNTHTANSDTANSDTANAATAKASAPTGKDAAHTLDAGTLQDGQGDEKTQSEAATLLARLHELVQQRLRQLGSQSRAYDVAVLLDASRNRATYHVQRDLQAALEFAEEDQLVATDPLGVYLGERKARSEREWLLGRFRGATLTDSQREAGELFLGSRFCAVQGPPGTGKTHLIANLAADALVKKLTGLVKGKHPRGGILLVTSTNNRAVDNVVEPLGRDTPPDRLPIALRVGSRDVIEKVTLLEFRRAKRWLDSKKPPSDDEFEAAARAYAELRAKVEAFTAPGLALQQSGAKLKRVEEDLAQLEAAQGSDTSEATFAAALRELGAEKPPASDSLQQLALALDPLARRLSELSTLADPERPTALIRLERHFQLTATQFLPPVKELLGAPLVLPLPPKCEGKETGEAREAWEQAAEEALALVQRLHAATDERIEVLSRDELLRRLRTSRDELRAADTKQAATATLDWKQLEPQLWDLTDAALTLRECWARAHQAQLGPALEAAIQACEKVKSLRALIHSAKGPGTWLRRLYPVWGCTLLSLGNNFNPETGLIDQVVIDEAGQCHPAYAVSALLRAQSALIIGDTNQLEPVVDLSREDEKRVRKSAKLRISEAQLAPFRCFEGSNTSAQSVADRVVKERPTLIDHFRCQPEIAAVCESLCAYGLRTHTTRRSCVHLGAELNHPLLHTPTQGEQRRFSGSWRNDEEVAQTVRWLRRLLSLGLAPSDIGVITPFRGQLETLWKEMRAARIPLERTHAEEEQATLFANTNSGVALGTVHRFQGGERRIILFSTTITEQRSLRFVDERVNLVNVAASRAKEHLITIGDTRTLESGVHTRVLVRDAREGWPG